MDEALAYPAEEAASLGAGRCQVTLAADGSILVSDAGRGTHTVVDDAGRVIRKPVMATRDVRFFSERRPPRLPDGQPRRGMSVVAALSSWLVHTNRCADGAWSQRYEYGVPVTDLQPVVADGSTGTSVRFFADPVLVPQRDVPAELVRQWATEWSALELSVHDDRPGMVRS